MSRILISGGAGFVASHIVDACIAEGYKVAVIDDLSTGLIENVNPAAEFLKADIGSNEASQFLLRWQPDILNHHAALASVVGSGERVVETLSVNIGGSWELLKAFVMCGGRRRAVFASTGGAIYGDADTLPTPEHHHLNPLSVYGWSKVAAESYFVAMRNAVILRYGNVYGPRQRPGGESGVVSIFADGILNGKLVTIYSGRHITRDFVHVRDVVRANMTAMFSEQACGDYSEVYNIGSGMQTPVSDVFTLVAGYCGMSGAAKHEPLRKGEVRQVCLDISKAAEWLDWEPQVDFRDGVKEVVEWVRTLG